MMALMNFIVWRWEGELVRRKSAKAVKRAVDRWDGIPREGGGLRSRTASVPKK